MRFFLSLLFVFSVFTGFSQPDVDRKLLQQVKEASYYDSARLFPLAEKAEVILKEKNNTLDLCELHLYRGNYYFYVRNLDKATEIFRQVLQEAKDRGNRKIEILTLVRLAYVQCEKGEMEEALKNMNDLLQTARTEKDFENEAEILNILGIIREQRNEIQEAVKLYLQGISVSEQHKLNYYYGVFCNNLGLIKYYSGQNKEALADYERGLKYAMLDNNARLVSHIKMNMCVIYIVLKQFEKASVLFTEVTEYSRKNNLPLELASVYINLATSFSAINRPEIGMQYIDSGIQVLDKHKLVTELERAYIGKCELFLQQKKINEALTVLAKVKQINDRTKNLENAVNYYSALYRIQKEKKNSAAALENYLIYTKLKDSLRNIVSEKAIRELQVKYDVQKKEVELEKERIKTVLLEKSNQEERFMKWIIIFCAAALLLFFVIMSVLFYSKKLRKKQEQFSQMLIKDIESERHRIARDLHDDVGQSLSIIKSKVNQNAQSEAMKNLDTELSRVIEQTRQISRNLYPSYLEKIGLVRAVAALMEKVQTSSGIECSFEISERIETETIDRKTHMYRVIQECVNNTIKHSGASALKISLETNNDEFIFTYRDNGKGFSSSRVGNGLGLQSISERVKIMQGTMSWGDKGEKGFVLNIKFKKSEKTVDS